MEDSSRIMKVKIFIIDVILIISTLELLNYYNNMSNYGLAALEDVGKVQLCLCFLAVEIFILIIIFILWLIKKIKHSWYEKDNCQTPACFMQHIAKVMSGTQIEGLYFSVGVDIAPKYGSANRKIIGSYIGGLKNPNYTESYYVLAQNIK